MRWYSVNLYVPPSCQQLFIRAVNARHDCKYDRYFVGTTENINQIKELVFWEMYNGQQFDIELSDYRVTHFAIPDPVEMEPEAVKQPAVTITGGQGEK